MFTSSCGISFVDVRVLLVKTDDFRWISTEIINWWRSMPANIYLPCQLVICDTQLSIRCLRIKDKRGACLRKKRWVPRHGRFVLYPGQFNDLLLQLYSLNATCKSYTATTHTDQPAVQSTQRISSNKERQVKLEPFVFYSNIQDDNVHSISFHAFSLFTVRFLFFLVCPHWSPHPPLWAPVPGTIPLHIHPPFPFLFLFFYNYQKQIINIIL